MVYTLHLNIAVKKTKTQPHGDVWLLYSTSPQGSGTPGTQKGDTVPLKALCFLCKRRTHTGERAQALRQEGNVQTLSHHFLAG